MNNKINNFDDGLVVDNFLDRDLYQELIYYIHDCDWRYGWPTSNSVKKYIFNCNHAKVSKFNKENIEEKLDNMLLKVWDAIKKKFGLTSLYNCYSNLMVEGLHAYPHCDSEEEDQVTVVLYICHQWDISYGGSTSIIRDNEIFKTVLPCPNRAFAFSGNQLHLVQSLTANCINPRITLMFKGYVGKNSNIIAQ